MKWRVGLAALMLAAAAMWPAGCSTSSRRAATATPESSPTITSTPSWTATDTLSPTPTSPPACGTPWGSGTPVTITVDCWNTGGCTVCGATSYVCISAISSCAFTDPCPGGMTARQIIAVVHAVPCVASMSFSTAVNGQPIGSDTGIANNCVCNACQNFCHSSAYFSGGFPSYVTAGTNSFEISAITGQLCLSDVALTVVCQ